MHQLPPSGYAVRLARIRGNWTFTKKPRQHHSYLRNTVLTPQRRLLIFLGAPGGATPSTSSKVGVQNSTCLHRGFVTGPLLIVLG